MKTVSFQISEIRTEDKPLVALFISENWGSQIVVSKGILLNTSILPGFMCIIDSKVIGLITYDIKGKDCEIVTLDSKINNHGLGTQLVKNVIEKARVNCCDRVWLITTNDNTKAIRFYQKRGFDWVGFYKDSLEVSRKIKPEIPEFGDDNIPISHEIEFELRL